MSLAFDAPGFAQRLLAVIPRAWFSDAARTAGGKLYAICYGAAAVAALHKSQLDYISLQTRIATATDTNLETIANDLFGVGNFPRAISYTSGTYTPESDAAYSLRIRQAVIAPQNTLAAIQNAVNGFMANFYFQAPAPFAELSEDSQGGLDTWGVFDAEDLVLGIPQTIPTIQVFDRQSNPILSAHIGLQPGQFCILFTFTGSLARDGFFLDFSYVDRDEYLLSDQVVSGPPLTPQAGAIIQAIKAQGYQPVWGYLQE